MISVTDNKNKINGSNVFILAKACSQRQLDAKKIESYLIENNYKIVNHPKFADFIIFVTCAFRNNMAENALKKVKNLQRYNAELIVAGCLPGIDKEELSKIFKGKVIITKDLNKIDSLFPKNLKKFRDLNDENVFFQRIDTSNIFGNIRTRITFIDNIYSNIKKNVYKIIFGEDTPYHIFIDVGTECFVDLLREPRTSESRIAPFQFEDGLDEFSGWTFRPRLSLFAR